MKNLNSFFSHAKDDLDICGLLFLFCIVLVLFLAGMAGFALGGFLLGRYAMDSIQDNERLSNFIAILATFAAEFLYCGLCIPLIFLGKIACDSYRERSVEGSLTV